MPTKNIKYSEVTDADPENQDSGIAIEIQPANSDIQSGPSSKSDNKMKVSESDPDMKKSTKVLAPNPEVKKKRKEDLENPDQKLKEETKMDPKGDSLLEPILTTWGSVHKETFQCLWEPIVKFNEYACDGEDKALCYCGCGFILIPLQMAYAVIFGLIQAAIAAFFGLISLALGVLFTMIGIWPAFILPVVITVLTIITLPINIYYRSLVAYREMTVKTNLKLITFIVLPFIQIFAPFIALISAMFTFIPRFASTSFSGYPLEPWREFPKSLGEVWTKLTSDIKEFAENNGHESGTTPNTWDGAAKGLALDLMWKPIKLQYEFCGDNFLLLGLSFILSPLNIAYAGILLFIQAMIAVLFAMTGITLTIIFTMVGIPPAFILAVGITGITIFTLPTNFYYHALVTYRTVLLRRDLKLLSFILLPVTQILVPAISLIVSLFTLFGWFVSVSFCGNPLKPWKEIPIILEKAYAKFTIDIKRYADNYGHVSGIPDNWNGKVYGLGVDPLVIAIAIFLYAFGVILMSPLILLTFILKAVPILAANVIKTWKFGLAFYVDAIKKYYSMPILTEYGNYLEEYGKLVKGLNPSQLYDCVATYNKECNPSQCINLEKIGCGIICLLIPILLAFASFIIGLVFVLAVPPIVFLIGLGMWIFGWPIVIAAPPVIYVGGWIAILFGIPLFFALKCCAITIGTPILCAFGCISGPFLAFVIPCYMMAYNHSNPIEMWTNARRSLKEGYKICKEIDKWTAELSFSKLRILPYVPVDETDNLPKTKEDEKRKIDYWNLFVERCIQESKDIQRKNWISTDDVVSISSNATIAIPGVAIAAILGDTAKRGNPQEMIFWNDENICRFENRERSDNIAQVFLPQLAEVKKSMISLKKEADLDICNTWIKASLCDGEDEKTKELATALNNITEKDDRHPKCLKIRSSIENIVHALLRVNTMNKRLPEIFNPVNDTKAEKQRTGSEALSEEDTELALALQVSAFEDQRAREEQRSADAILLNVDSQPTTPQTIKYSEDVEPENQNSDIVIEMKAASATDSDTLLSSSNSDSDNKRRGSETVLDILPNDVLATNTDASPVHPKPQT